MFDKVNGARVGASNRVFAACCGLKAPQCSWSRNAIAFHDGREGADRREILQPRDPLFEQPISELNGYQKVRRARNSSKAN